MDNKTKKQLQAIADTLIETLHSQLEGKEADEIVARCARTKNYYHVDLYKKGLLTNKKHVSYQFVPKAN